MSAARKKFLYVILFSSLTLSLGSLAFLKDCTSFLYAFLRSPQGIGSVIPSSRFTSKAMARYTDSEKKPVKILEIGAGTGPATAKIIEKMGFNDQLDVIEINSELCALLKEKFGKHKNVTIHCLSVLDWNPDYKYDFIVSAIPHNAFGVKFVNAVLGKYQELIKSNGILSYIEYLGLANLKKIFLMGSKKEIFLQTNKAMSSFRNRFEVDSEVVALNIPPTHVYYLQITK
ncbi:methyltransferase domain-containing protein [bacterium]|nr:methyltransferase domain-containing protein [bacterium]